MAKPKATDFLTKDAPPAKPKATDFLRNEPAPALGVSKSHEAALDTEGLAQAAQTRDEARTDVLVREGMRRDEALERARAEYVGSNLKAPGRTTPEAYVATQAGREGDNSPGDVARRAAAPITRRLDQPLPTGGKQEDEWRDLVMQNYAAMASPDEWEVVMDRMMKHPEGSDAEAAKAAGIDKSWVQDIKDGMWDVASAIAAPASRGFTSMSEEDDAKAAAGVQKVWNGIKGAAFDKDVIKVTDVMTPAQEGGSIVAPDVDGIAPSGPRALLQRAAIKVAPIETYSMLAAALGGDYGAAYRTTQFIRDARPDETFDAFSELVRQAGDDPDAQNDVIRRLDNLAPNDIPDRDVGGSYDPATWSVLLRTNPEARANPAFARVYTALDGNQSPERIEAELREVPFGQLATVKPSVGPTLGAIRELGTRRAKALKASGGDTSAALERLAGSALVERVVEEGKPRYVENRAGQVLRLAGVLAEGVYETDLKVTDLPGPYLYTGIIAAADAAGAEDFARALQEMPLPTKASLDRALATGAYDSWREEFGMAGAYRPLRDDPGGWKGWVARVAANTQMPEFAGTGYTATYERAGGDVTSPVGAALGFVDFTVDMLNPVDDLALHGITTVAGRGARAASVARLAPSGAKWEAAAAAALPEVMASGVDRDAITAVNQAIERAVVKAHDEGDFVQLPELFDREVDAVLGQATSENVKGAVRKAAEKRRARVVAAKQKMLDRGGTPEQLALRGTPAYQRRVAEYDALVQDGKITPDQKSVGLAMDEVRAFILSDEGKVGTPEEYFGRVKRETGGTSGPGAYFQGTPEPGTGPAFRAWFGDSKVVDEKGAPLVVYHGTRRDFNAFSNDASAAYGKWYSSGFYFTDKPEVAEAYATSFRPQKQVTGWAAGEDVWAPDEIENAAVIPAYVSIKNPYVWPEGERASLRRAVSLMNPERLPDDLHDAVFARLGVDNVADLRARWGDAFLSYQNEQAQAAIADAVRDELRSRGYDGIIVHTRGKKKKINGSERGYTHDEYIAFDPEQIKSAIANRGTFDPRDPNILHSTIGGKQTEQGTIERVIMPALREKAPTFYSALRRTVADIKQERLTAEQLRGMLAKAPGVKADEIEWTGLDRFLAEHPKPTKTEVLDWLDENAVVVEEKRLKERTPEDRAVSQEYDRLITRLGEVRYDLQQTAAAPRGDFIDMLAPIDPSRQPLIDEENVIMARLAEIRDARRAAERAPEPHYANYQLPGGTNYREVLFKLPEEQSPASLPPGWLIKRESFGTDIEGETAGAEFVVYGPDGDVVARGPTDRAALRAAEEATGESLAATTNDVEAARYQAPHFGNEGRNLLAHTRLSDRVGPNGEKILHVEEIQSDWHQAGREKGYRGVESPAEKALMTFNEEMIAKYGTEHPDDYLDFMTPEEGTTFNRLEAAAGTDDMHRVPAAPFAKSWHELVMKRILREAAENGYDGVTWTTGVQQVKRYEDATRQAVDEIRWRRPTPENVPAVMEAADRVAKARAAKHAAHDAFMAAINERPVNERAIADTFKVNDEAEAAYTDAIRQASDTVGFAPQMFRDGVWVDDSGRFDLADPNSAMNLYRRRLESYDGVVPGGHVQIIGSKNGREVYRETMPPEKVADVLGKGMAAKIAESTEASGSLTGADLTIGGEGMKGFYDQMLPSFVQKYVKKWGGKVGGTTIEVKPPLRESERAMGSSEWARDYDAASREPVHYLPLTPQMRDAILYEGQPLFQRVKGAVRGSIEPAIKNQQAIGYIQRFFNGADFDTLLHEDAHLLRFMFGDDWTNDLARHFDHVVDPTTGRVSLTRKGEEQTAEALRYYFRTKMQPDGYVRGLLDRVYVMKQNLWLPLRGEAKLLPTELSAMWDASLRPSDTLNAPAVKIADMEALRKIPNVTTVDDPAQAVAANVEPRSGKLREFARIDAVPAESRAALGIDASTVEMDPLQLYARAVAHVVTEKYRATGWGNEALVRLGTRGRVAVPKSRAERVIADVAARTRAILGNDAPVIVGERMQFTPAQAAGVKSIVNEIVHSPLGDGLSAEARTFDAHAPNASLSVKAWNDLHDRLIDIHAGVGAARRRGAEEIATAPLFAAIWRTLANPMIEQVLDRKEGMRHLDNMIEMFRVDDEMAKYMHPQAREAIDEGVRALGHISEEVISDVRALSRGERSDRTVAMGRLVFNHSRPVVQVGDAGRIMDATTWFGDVNGTWTGGARIGGTGHGPLPTLDGLFDNKAAKLDAFEGLMARNPIAGEATLLPREQVAFTELRRLDVQRVQAGQTWADVLANPMDEAMLGDSLAIVQHGINVRQSMLLRQADELVVRLAGSNDRSVLTRLAPTERIAVYNDFWTGAWDSMFDRVKSLGQEVIGPSYDQQAAILSVVTGLRADTVINRLGERLLDLGVGLDLDRATTLGMGPASSYANEIGQRGPDGFNATRSRVLGWINRIVTWKEAGITRLEPVTMPDGSIQMKPTRWQDPAGEFMNRVDMDAPEQREAYTLANRYLSILGWKHGKGSFGDMAVVFPDGREMFIPEFVWGEIQATVERTAKTGVAFADAKARGLGGAFHELAGAIARRSDEPAAYLGLAEADNTASRMTPLMPQEEAVQAKRRAATWTGTVGGATVGGALAGPPGAIAGALIGRNVVPTAIDVAGNLARRGAKDAGMVGAVVGGASGAVIGAALGAVKTAVDGLRVAFPMTLALGRVGMTAGLVIAHPAFFVGNVFGALFQTYMRTGVKGVAGAFGALMSNPQTASYLLASMADGWGDRAMRVLPTPRPLVTRTGAVWTPEMLVDACKRYGLDSSYVKAESTGALVDAIKNITGKWTDKLLDAPIQTGMTPVREWQALIMESATAIDNANRIGVFLDNLQRGVEPHMAASIARDAAFDYGKLTDVERTVMRNTVLFYSYMRQSVDLFWWSLINNPSRVLGILRATNGQRYDDIDAPDVVVPESMDSRLILSYRDAIRDGHAVQGVATVSPRIPLDMIPLWSDMMGAWQGDQESALKLAGRLTPPIQWGLNKTFGVDTFSGMPLNDYNEVPEWWVETMRNTTGSLMDDLLGIEPLERRDPKSEPYRDAPRYQARNGQMWWLLRTAIQTPMFGRSISTLTAADRAGIGGGAGPVQQIVDWSRDYRSSGGNASWDAFFNGPGRDIARSLFLTEESRGLLAEPRTFPVGTRPDVTPARPWTVNDEEDWALLGMPSMQMDTYDVARNNAAADILRTVNEQVKKEQAAREGRYGR